LYFEKFKDEFIPKLHYMYAASSRGFVHIFDLQLCFWCKQTLSVKFNMHLKYYFVNFRVIFWSSINSVILIGNLQVNATAVTVHFWFYSKQTLAVQNGHSAECL